MNKKIIISLIVILPLIVGGVFYLPKWENFSKFNPLTAAIGSLFQLGNKETETLKSLEEIKSELERLQEEISLLEERLETEQEARDELELKYETEITSLAAKFDNLVKIVDNFGRQMNTISQTEELKEEIIEEEIEEELGSEIDQEIILCQKREGDFPKRNKAIFNEVAWMGTTNSANDEWIELKNISNSLINLTGWQILNKEKRIKIVFATGTIPVNGFFLLERTSDDAVPGVAADLIFTGAIKNSDEALYLFDENCQLQDEVIAAPDWPAGDNSSKRTMERKPDLTWQTSANPGGTPKRENSSGYVVQQIGTTPTTSGSSSQPKPQISLSYPSQIPVDEEIEVTLSVSNLKNAVYDVKISIETETATLSDIYSETENKWQTSYNYLKSVFSGTSFSRKFKLKIKQDKTDFRGEANIIARVRESGKSSYLAFEGKINITNSETQNPQTQNQPPIASFTFSPKHPLIDEEVLFDASSSTDPDGQIISYIWDFGNGTSTTANQATTTHSYSTSRVEYVVTLRVIDNQGATSSTSTTISVIESEIATNIVITEVRIKDKEYIELYNPTDELIPLNGWYLSYFLKNKNWNEPYRKWEFPATSTISAESYLLIGIYGESLEVDWIVLTSNKNPYAKEQLNNDVGAIGVFSSSTISESTKIDLFGWKRETTSGEVISENNPFSFKTDEITGKSFQRKKWQGFYVDNDNNLIDFEISTPTPKS